MIFGNTLLSSSRFPRTYKSYQFHTKRIHCNSEIPNYWCFQAQLRIFYKRHCWILFEICLAHFFRKFIIQISLCRRFLEFLIFLLLFSCLNGFTQNVSLAPILRRQAINVLNTINSHPLNAYLCRFTSHVGSKNCTFFVILIYCTHKSKKPIDSNANKCNVSIITLRVLHHLFLVIIFTIAQIDSTFLHYLFIFSVEFLTKISFQLITIYDQNTVRRSPK